MLTAILIFITSIQLASLRNISFDIYKGEGGHIQEYKFAASLFIEVGDEKHSNKGEACGASIINQIVLLTAANCVLTTPDKVEAYTGSRYTWEGTMSPIKRIRTHPKFKESTFDRDLALLVVDSPLTLGLVVGRVALLPQWQYLPFVAAGFGNRDVEGQHDYLRLTKQRILTRRWCLQRVKCLNEGSFCTKGPPGYPALDDAGSALVQRKYILAGLMSFVVGYRDETLAIYTNVTFYHHWITSNAQRITCSYKHTSQEDSLSDSDGSRETAEEESSPYVG